MTKKDKIQHLLISYLLEEGSINLNLPDGMSLEIGIVKKKKNGALSIEEDYCSLTAIQKDREVSIDSYNFGLKFNDDNGRIILEDRSDLINGAKRRSFTVI